MIVDLEIFLNKNELSQHSNTHTYLHIFGHVQFFRGRFFCLILTLSDFKLQKLTATCA